jgi:hypothetical protein
MTRTKPWSAGVGLLFGVVMAWTVTALVQEPSSSPPGDESPPTVRERMAQNPVKFQLRRELRALEEINRDPATAVSPAQAKQLLAVLEPWTMKQKMTEENAKAILRSVQKVMTPRQLNAMAQARPQRGAGGFGGPGGRDGGWGRFRGPGRPEGAGWRGGEGGPPRFDASRMRAMRDANILSTKENPDMPWSSQRAVANKRLIAMLEARARGSTL